MSQEKEFVNIESCPFERSSENDSILKSADSATVQIPPMRFHGKTSKWTRAQFHELLTISPTETVVPVADSEVSAENGDAEASPALTKTDILEGFVLQFQGMARESLAVFLSPKQGFWKHGYEIIFGHDGDTLTLVQRCSSQQTSVRRPNRACVPGCWTSYWVCFSGNKLYVGVGDTPGAQLLALFDDTSRKQPQTTKQAIQYIGIGNASKGDRQAPSPLKIRNIRLEPLSDDMRDAISSLTEENVQVILLGEVDEATQKLWDNYKEECEKAKARSLKFGVPYTEPPPPVVSMNWSDARKLRANPKEGFITGMDLEDPEEKAKQEKRRQRFGELTDSTPSDALDSTENEISKEEASLPMGQAWDNEQLVRKLRSDPPATLWTNPPPDLRTLETDAFRMDTVDPPTLVGDKIHIFSIDWGAFKQIRTNDIMKHFGIYGPTYVEWLGDLSCNVCFEDQFSASRALHVMSTELPTPAPDDIKESEADTLPDLGNMGWRLGKTMLRKIANDRYGRRGTTARLLLRKSNSLDILKDRPTSWPKPPAGFSTKRVLGPGSDSRTGKKKQKRQRDLYGQNDNVTTFQDTADIMAKGLSSTRDGFSIEEMEAERASKRARKSSDAE